MSTIPVVKKDVPFWLGGDGDLTVDVGKLVPTQSIPEDTTELIAVNFGAAGQENFKLGGENTVTLGVKAGAHESLTPIFAATAGSAADKLKQLGLQDFFK